MQFCFLLLLALSTLSQANTSNEFVVCYDFGCKSTQSIHYSNGQWQLIEQIFSRPAISAWQEKQQIRQAVALMERFSGHLAGTEQDKAGNYPGDDIPGQQDCIDESTNTLQYLSALERRGFLTWHEVVGKKRRIVWLFTHWTAVIREKNTGKQYAVDSWYRDNGQPPYIQALNDWQLRREFPETLNP